MRVEQYTQHHAKDSAALSRVVAFSMLLSACSGSNAYGSEEDNKMDVDNIAIYHHSNSKSDSCLDDSAVPYCP